MKPFSLQYKQQALSPPRSSLSRASTRSPTSRPVSRAETSPRSEWGGSFLSIDPETGQRLGTAVSVISYMSELDNESLHSRRMLWNARSSLNTPFQPAWSQYGRFDKLNVNLEAHPFWVAKAPGTFDHTRERWTVYQNPPASTRSRRPSTGWDARFVSAHALDGNPVHNGMRVLSPARRRHNGGVGAEGLI